MDFALNEEQLELQEMVRDFVEKEITPYAAEMDRNNQSMPGLLEKAADMGAFECYCSRRIWRTWTGQRYSCRYL